MAFFKRELGPVERFESVLKDKLTARQTAKKLKIPVIPGTGHVDTSAKAGVKHVYTVIALNSAGVPSVASLPATVT